MAGKDRGICYPEAADRPFYTREASDLWWVARRVEGEKNIQVPMKRANQLKIGSILEAVLHNL